MSAYVLISGVMQRMKLKQAALIKEQYQGIRPAPGYPACPDHTVKPDMFKVLQAEAIGMQLTESFAMSRAHPCRVLFRTS